ncbi:MAG: hypothetical protein MK085_13645, partial [Phycisphaerales bacterium]|nr:hypothetical protein [Phycisphaerales bacterium]
YDNWPDFRGYTKSLDQIPPRYCTMQAWCHGSPGITLNRAVALQIEDHPGIRDDCEFGLAQLQDMNPPIRTHLCCGGSGHAEILRIIGILMNNSEAIHQSRGCLNVTLKKFMNEETKGTLGLGLMRGEGGVCWAALSAIDDSENNMLMLNMP